MLLSVDVHKRRHTQERGELLILYVLYRVCVCENAGRFVVVPYFHGRFGSCVGVCGLFHCADDLLFVQMAISTTVGRRSNSIERCQRSKVASFVSPCGKERCGKLKAPMRNTENSHADRSVILKLFNCKL